MQDDKKDKDNKKTEGNQENHQEDEKDKNKKEGNGKEKQQEQVCGRKDGTN